MDKLCWCKKESIALQGPRFCGRVGRLASRRDRRCHPCTFGKTDQCCRYLLWWWWQFYHARWQWRWLMKMIIKMITMMDEDDFNMLPKVALLLFAAPQPLLSWPVVQASCYIHHHHHHCFPIIVTIIIIAIIIMVTLGPSSLGGDSSAWRGFRFSWGCPEVSSSSSSSSSSSLSSSSSSW